MDYINLDALCDVLNISSITCKAYDYLCDFWAGWCNDLQKSVEYSVIRKYSNLDETVKSALIEFLMDETETSDNIEL